MSVYRYTIINDICIPGFQIFRNNCNRHGGGVLLYVSSLFVVSVVSSPSPTLEILTLSISLDTFKVYTFIPFYRPPSSTPFIFDTLDLFTYRIYWCLSFQ